MVGAGALWCVAGRRAAPSGRVRRAAGAVVVPVSFPVSVPVSVSVSVPLAVPVAVVVTDVYRGTSVSIVAVVIIVVIIVGVLVSVGRLGTLVVDHLAFAVAAAAAAPITTE